MQMFVSLLKATTRAIIFADDVCRMLFTVRALAVDEFAIDCVISHSFGRVGL